MSIIQTILGDVRNYRKQAAWGKFNLDNGSTLDNCQQNCQERTMSGDRSHHSSDEERHRRKTRKSHGSRERRKANGEATEGSFASPTDSQLNTLRAADGETSSWT
jgi:hypothetical protein